MKSFLERVADVKTLWTMALATVPLPSDDKLLYWCGRYGEAEIEHGVMRASAKLHKGGLLPTTSECEKYVSGVMSHEAQKVREKLARVLTRTRGAA